QLRSQLEQEVSYDEYMKTQSSRPATQPPPAPPPGGAAPADAVRPSASAAGSKEAADTAPAQPAGPAGEGRHD
ncbi:MAG TPA: hypothetical protein VLT59_10775, partial [Steroidobacteraceae bacterium]|nr:hypothetical protein [Steroidobacteraceae bacterium]